MPIYCAAAERGVYKQILKLNPSYNYPGVSPERSVIIPMGRWKVKVDVNL